MTEAVFRAGKHESDASPDPWWIAGNYCFVFEDHSDAKPTSTLGADKARQVAGHPKWMTENVALTQIPINCFILPILVTPVLKAESGARPHLKDVSFWKLADFKAWAFDALSKIRSLRRALGEEGDLVWRAEALQLLEENQFDAPGLYRMMTKQIAADTLKSK